MVQSFKDGTGNQAVQIKIHLKQALWKHVLFYDETHKRTKVMKYANGHYLP